MTRAPAVYYAGVWVISHAAGPKRMGTSVSNVEELPIVRSTRAADPARCVDCMIEHGKLSRAAPVRNPGQRESIFILAIRIRINSIVLSGLVFPQYGDTDHPVIGLHNPDKVAAPLLKVPVGKSFRW